MKESQVLSSYDFHAKVYWATFGASLQPARKLAVRSLDCRPGERLLEIGVGTGWSLPMYPPGVEIQGIDLNPRMVAKAQGRAQALGLDPAGFKVMDACRLSYPDNSFDKSAALFVASVAPDPKGMVREMKRVTRPGGVVCIANHFSKKSGIMSYVERFFAPIGPWMGFRTIFPLDQFLEDTGLAGAEAVPVPPFGYWQVLLFRNKK